MSSCLDHMDEALGRCSLKLRFKLLLEEGSFGVEGEGEDFFVGAEWELLVGEDVSERDRDTGDEYFSFLLLVFLSTPLASSSLLEVESSWSSSKAIRILFRELVLLPLSLSRLDLVDSSSESDSLSVVFRRFILDNGGIFSYIM